MENNKEFSKICIKCQECCKTIAVQSIYQYCDEVIEFYETRGGRTKKFIFDDQELLLVEFDLKCPHLDDEKGCMIYDHRPKVCRDYPTDDIQLLKKCQLHIQGLI
ncbi:MAG TPA: YkgJ family cysteine cluster protein [Candidatus Dojkabacteria bacterium]|nr:YkgJ family cysteine cluster protein [Candidatus Dojkabacteria bacterium]